MKTDISSMVVVKNLFVIIFIWQSSGILLFKTKKKLRVAWKSVSTKNSGVTNISNFKKNFL